MMPPILMTRRATTAPPRPAPIPAGAPIDPTPVLRLGSGMPAIPATPGELYLDAETGVLYRAKEPA